MGLVRWGSLGAATDATMATVTNSSGSRFRTALETLLGQIATGIISGNTTVVAAAEAAVVNAMATWGFSRPSDVPQYLVAFGDSNGVLSQMRVRATDGKFPDDVVEDFANRMGTTSAGATVTSARGIGAFPILAARAADARAKAQPCAIVFTGSSTTADNGVSQEQGYVAILMAAIQARWPSMLGSETSVQKSSSATFVVETARGMHGYNAGEGGTTAVTYLTNEECDRIAALKPAAIIHMVGSNDYKQQVSISSYRSTLESRLAYLDSKLTRPCQQILVQPYQRRDITSPPIPWRDYGDALREIAAGRADTKYVDISAAYAAVGVPGSDPLSIIREDGIHQYANGYRLMADLLIDQILG